MVIFESDLVHGPHLGSDGLKLTCTKKLGEFPNACSGYFNFTVLRDTQKAILGQGFAKKDILHYGIGVYVYAFSTYDETTGAVGPVLQVVFSMGKVDGLCFTEYEVTAPDSCFGLVGSPLPVTDPPKPPSLSHLVEPPLPAFQAVRTPGISTGAVIAIVLLVLVMIGGCVARVILIRRQNEEALRTAQEIELN